MELSYFPMVAVRVTGSEQASSHVGTYNIDLSYGANQNFYAPFTCKVVKIYQLAGDANTNSVWFQSVEPVKTPKFTDYVVFRCAHMSNADTQALGIAMGKVFKQGEVCYRAGNNGLNSTGVHIHMAFGRGKFVAPGWAKNPTTGNWFITNQVHMWEAVYLKAGTPILGQENPAGYAYKSNWVVAPQPAPMVAVANRELKTPNFKVRVRELPSTGFAQIGTLCLPLNSTVKVLAVSASKADGYDWVQVQVGDVVGYSAMVDGLTIVETLTPMEIVQKQLAEANKTIEAKNLELASLKTRVTALDAEVKSFKQITKTVYEKV